MNSDENFGQEKAETARPADAPDLFISFSTSDVSLTDRVVAELKKDFGDRIFYSRENMHASVDRWDQTIQSKLNSAYVILGLESPAAYASNEVHAEWNYGFKRNKLMIASILPLDCERSYRWETRHAGDLTSWLSDARDKQIQDLRKSLKEFVDQQREMRKAQPAEQPRQNHDLKQVEQKKPENNKEVPAPQQEPKRFDVALSSQQSAPEQLAIAMLEPPTAETPSEKSLGSASNVKLDKSLPPELWNCRNATELLARALEQHTIEDIRSAADTGNSDAEALIGIARMYGLGGISRDFEAAARRLWRASQNGHARAKAELSHLLALSKSKDTDRINTLSLDAIAAGNTRAKTLRALVRRSGVRLPDMNIDETVALFEQAHNEGDRLASAYLGWSLMFGSGVRRDPTRAYEILREASRMGEPRAMVHFGIMHAFGHATRRDPDKALHWFRLSAAGSDPWGQFYYGWAYEHAVGVGRDAAEARRWFQKASEQGDIEACVHLGRMLIEGRGGAKDLAKAAAVLEPAAAAGDGSAASLLGHLYENGFGVAKDLTRAVELYRIAADDDDPSALFNLAVLYEDGRGVARNTEEAKKLFRAAARSAPSHAFYRKVRMRLEYYGVNLPSFNG